MIDTIAKRAFNLNGTDYSKGDTVPMPLQQFEDLEPTGLVGRAAAVTKAKPKSRSRTAKKVSTLAAGLHEPIEPQAAATGAD